MKHTKLHAIFTLVLLISVTVACSKLESPGSTPSSTPTTMQPQTVTPEVLTITPSATPSVPPTSASTPPVTITPTRTVDLSTAIPPITPTPQFVNSDEFITLVATPAPVLHVNWTSYTNANREIQDLTFDKDGYLWTASKGGGVRWNFADGSYIKYTVEHGLAANDVRSILATSDGVLWFGTNDHGVSRFDGQTWTTYTVVDGLPSNSIQSMVETPDGIVWFGTSGGLSFFDGQAWNSPPIVLVGNIIFMTVAFDGALWISTEIVPQIKNPSPYSYVYRFDGQTWTTYTPDEGWPKEPITAIDITPDGTVWLGLRWGGVMRFDGQTWTTYTADDVLINNRVGSIFKDPNGDLWVGTLFDGISQFDEQTWTKHTTHNGLGSNNINTIKTAPDDTLWVGTNYGISHFDGQTWRTYITADGLAGYHDVLRASYVCTVAVDPNGVAWFGTYGSGVSRFDGQIWTTYTTEDGLVGNDVSSIAIDNNGIVWFGTSDGLSRFDGQTWTTYTTDNGLVDNFIRVVAIAPDNSLWMGTSRGISHFDGQTWTNYTSSSGFEGSYDNIFALAIAPDGTVWVGTGNNPDGAGVSRFDGQNWHHYKATNGLGGNSVNTISIASDGMPWVGTCCDGVYRFDGDTWKFVDTPEYSTLDFRFIQVLDIVITPDDNLWVSTIHNDGGILSHFDGQTWSNITTADGVVHEYVYFTSIAPDGSLWFVTQDGVSRFWK